MSLTRRLYAALVLVLFVFGQFCVAAPFIANTVLHRSGLSVHVQRPGRLMNVPVAQLAVPYVFQLDPHMFTIIDSDSRVPLKESPIVALDPDSNVPPWLNFDPESLILSGIPDAVPNSPFRIRLVATAPDGGDTNDTAFDLYISKFAPPSLTSHFENQQNSGLMSLVNATPLATKSGMWIRPGATFVIHPQAFCSPSNTNSSLFYTAYHSTGYNLDPLPEWLHFDNTTLEFTGAAPINPTSLNVLVRCSNIFGAGGREQTLFIDVSEHEIEIRGTPHDLELIGGQPFKYTFQWTYDHLLVDTNNTNLWTNLYSNGSLFPITVDPSEREVGFTVSLENYPWMRFDPGLHGRNNATIFGVAPLTNQTLPLELAPIPLNITARGQQIDTNIRVISQPASPWHPELQVSVDTQPANILTHDFELDLIESLRGDHRWDIFLQIKDPLNDTDWIHYNQTTHVFNGTVPYGSIPRRIVFEGISNAWGFNTTRTFYVNVFNPQHGLPPTYPPGWSPTSVTVAVSLSLSILFLLMSLFAAYGMWKGFIISPLRIYRQRRRQRSSQTLVNTSLESTSSTDKPGHSDIQEHIEHKVESTISGCEAPCMECEVTASRVQHDIHGAMILAVPSSLPSPTSVTTPSTLATRSASGSSSSAPTSGLSSFGNKLSASQESSLKGKLKFLKNRVVFGKGRPREHLSKPTVVAAAVPRPYVKQNDKPFTPMWKGHVYQTPELLKAERDAWKARRLERKARLKREYFAKKETEAQGCSVDICFPAPKEEDDAPKPGAARRFGIFAELAKWEDLDRRGPANMRADALRSRLVEVGENRFFNDTMVNRSEVGSSEFSSLASWESLSESSVADMVLCYGQIGRRKVRPGDAPKSPKISVDFWGGGADGPVYREEGSLPKPDDDTITDENLLGRLAHALGSDRSLDEHGDELSSIDSHLGPECQEIGGSAAAISSVKWKGKSVARGEYGSLTTSQHSPTFKKLAHHRFRASIDNVIAGSSLSKAGMTRSLAWTSPSTQSITTGASGDLSPSSSLKSLFFHLSENGVYFYVIPAGTKFCFTAQITKVAIEGDYRPTFGRAKASPYVVEPGHPDDLSMPLWLNFNAPSLQFWGFAPDTNERLDHSMKIVHRATGDVVGKLLIVVVRIDEVANTQAMLGYPNAVNPAPRTVATTCSTAKLAAAINLACSPQVTGLPSTHSLAASFSGTNLSHSESTTSVVFHLTRDGIDFFAISANSDFCFQLPGFLINATKPTLGRAVVSPYGIQMDETSEVTSIPHWLNFVAQSMEFYGTTPDVVGRLRVGMKIVSRETGQVAMRVLIVVARLDDIGSLQSELSYGSIEDAEGLSVVEEVSSLDSNGDCIRDMDEDTKTIPTEPKTPERSRATISASSSRGARSFRGTIRSQPGSKFNSPVSRRSPGTWGRGGQMRALASGRLGGGDDYDSMMFEGRSQYSGSLFGPELGTLAGGPISSGALEAMSRAASRTGSISFLSEEHTVVVAPTTMNGVEYYVILGAINFCFTIQLPKGRPYSVAIEAGKKGQPIWAPPGWIGVEVHEDIGTLDFSGTTHELDEHVEYGISVRAGDTGDVIKCLRVVVVPNSKA
ncbi:transmembrane protein [Ceratobasidium sp. AG-Ba]|nr:transmembrane protein [Ceratobasidium sp. AG-Ba]